MRPALLLVDVQKDFLARGNVTPSPDILISHLEILLNGCRQRCVPVLHSQTRIRPDGSNRMPHWKEKDIRECIEGTHGAEPPDELTPLFDEPVFSKQFFNAFADKTLSDYLYNHAIDTLIVAGLYLHACVRSSVLEAYEQGYKVLVIDDAVASNNADHAEMTRKYLHGRAATFLSTQQLFAMLDKEKQKDVIHCQFTVPVAYTGGKWVQASGHDCFSHYDPSSRQRLLDNVPLANETDVDSACQSAVNAFASWKNATIEQRLELLHAWLISLERRKNALIKTLVTEIGKPLTDSKDEIYRAIAHIRSTIRLLEQRFNKATAQEHDHLIRYVPHGCVGLITPWNNPIAIPVGKIAPALACANTVVWKPALQAPRSAMLVIETLAESGLESGIINMIFGDSLAARQIVSSAAVSAISLTGSIDTGHIIANQCTKLGKPLQAELGGNNAAIICNDSNLEDDVLNMAMSAFSFSGQRCTSIQRFIVDTSILQDFETRLKNTVESLTIGNPEDGQTHVGPLISQQHLNKMLSLIQQATDNGARILSGGKVPEGLENGYWLLPTILTDIQPDSRIAQEEIFGPIALILPAQSIEEAIKIANGVKQGLVATLYSHDPEIQKLFAAKIEAGILNFTSGPIFFHPDAPFTGWKSSAIGPPEHGEWDRQFYCKTQTLYGYSSNKA